MTLVDLSRTLAQNSSVVGNHCENIGKYEGSGLFRKKILISYDRDKGWNCVKLNRFVLFFRDVFGFFPSTHLDHVARGFLRSKNHTVVINQKLDPTAENLVLDFDKRIHDLWNRSHASKTPFPENVFFNNNSSFSLFQEANLLQKHFKKQYQEIVKDLGEENNDSKTLELRVKEFVEDLPELSIFINPEIPQYVINISKKTILDNFDQLKKNEITSFFFRGIILGVIKKLQNPIVIKKLMIEKLIKEIVDLTNREMDKNYQPLEQKINELVAILPGRFKTEKGFSNLLLDNFKELKNNKITPEQFLKKFDAVCKLMLKIEAKEIWLS